MSKTTKTQDKNDNKTKTVESEVRRWTWTIFQVGLALGVILCLFLVAFGDNGFHNGSKKPVHEVNETREVQ